MTRKRFEKLGRVFGIGLDGNGGVLCGKAVPEDGLDVEADDLEVDQKLEGLGEVCTGEAEEIGLRGGKGEKIGRGRGKG